MVIVKSNKKIWLSIVLGLGGLFLLVVLAINPLLKNLLATQVQTKLVGNFYYNYENLTVDLMSRSVTLENVTWRFPKDTTVFNHKGSIGRLKISGVSLLPLIGGNHFRIGEIRFDSLNLVTRIEKEIAEDSIVKIIPSNVSLNFYDFIKGQMKSLNVEKIEINNGRATWLNPETKIIWRKIENVHFDIRQIQLDSVSAANNNGWFTLSQATLEGKNGQLFLADSLHKIHLKKIQIDYNKKTLVIDSLELIPLFEKSEMRFAQRYETDRLAVTAPKILVTGMDIGALMVSNQLRIERILIDHLNLDVFRDKNPPIPNNHYIELPQILLKKAKLNIKIDSMHLTNSHIRYEELSDMTQQKGVVFFSELNADFYNITNDSVSSLQSSKTKLNASAKLMGKAKLDVEFTFNLLSENGDHWFKGKLSSMDLTELNSVFVPLEAFSIRSGYLDQLEFDIRLNNEVSDGKITFLYADLKIDKLNKEDLKQKEFDNLMISTLANTFLLHTNNPSGKDDPRIGMVHTRRTKSKNIFDFWVESIFDGMKSTALKTKEN